MEWSLPGRSISYPADCPDRDNPSGMENLFPTISDPQRSRSETLENVVNASNHYFQKSKTTWSASTTKEDMLAALNSIFDLM